MDDLTLFNSNHRIILSCTKSVRLLFERTFKRAIGSNHKTSLTTVRPSILRHLLSSLVLPLTLLSPSDLTSVLSPLLPLHRLLKLNSIFYSTYGPSTSTLIRLYKSYTRSLFDYGALAICVASPDIQLSWEGIQTHFISRALSIPSFIRNDRKRSTRTFHPSMTETCT